MIFSAYFASCTVLALVYVILLAIYRYGWDLLEEWEVPNDFTPTTSISIIIPARNEEAFIGACIQSILVQNYPKHLLEIFVIDDHSSDQTASIVRSFADHRLRLLNLKDYEKTTTAFKKAGIEFGIQNSRGELIITTDADCVLPSNWLDFLVSFYENGSYSFIAAPVQFHHTNTLMERFQALDFLGMMLITGSGIRLKWMHLCNGANLAYPRAVFEEVGGFEGVDHLASGDDMLLLHKVAKHYPDQIGFVKSKEAAAQTEAKKSWAAFFQQRMRWATKSAHYQEWQVTLVLAMVFFLCCTIFLNLLLVPFLGWSFLFLALAQLAIKTIADYFFLRQAAQYFGRLDLMRSFLPSQFLHLAYIIGIGIFSNLVKSYRWKGRRVQ